MMALRDQNSRWPHILGKCVGYMTIALILGILFFFLIWPVGIVVRKAFVANGEWTFAFFKLLFANSLQTDAILNSLYLGVATTILATIVTIPLAIIGVRYDYPGKGVLSGLLLVPMVLPPFVGAIGVQRFFARMGSVNLFLLKFGIVSEPIDWLAGSSAFWMVVVLEVLHLYPIMYLNMTAALANVDPSLEEMAMTLGVSRWRQLKDIVWPLARPGYFAGAIIVFIWALTDLGTPLLVGFHNTMPVQIFNMVTDINENPVGYAMVVLVIAITVGIFITSKYLFASKKYDMMAKGHVTSPTQKATGWQIPLCLAIVGGMSFIALLPHVSVVLTSLSDKWFMTILPEQYTTKYYGMVFQQELSLVGIKNSFFYASLSTFVDLILGILVAFVVTRKLVPMAQALDSLVMVPLALPGIVIAFGYVVAYSDTFLDPLQNPVPLLVIAYAIRRLPYMVRSASAGLQQLSVSLEEASATFGATAFYTLRKITVPLVMANLIAGGLLCFAYAMLDVSDSLILAMKDRFYPITKAIYSLFLEHGSGEFVASSLGVIAMAILAACIFGASLILGKKMGEIFRS